MKKEVDAKYRKEKARLKHAEREAIKAAEWEETQILTKLLGKKPENGRRFKHTELTNFVKEQLENQYAKTKGCKRKENVIMYLRRIAQIQEKENIDLAAAGAAAREELEEDGRDSTCANKNPQPIKKEAQESSDEEPESEDVDSSDTEVDEDSADKDEQSGNANWNVNCCGGNGITSSTNTARVHVSSGAIPEKAPVDDEVVSALEMERKKRLEENKVVREKMFATFINEANKEKQEEDVKKIEKREKRKMERQQRDTCGPVRKSARIASVQREAGFYKEKTDEPSEQGTDDQSEPVMDSQLPRTVPGTVNKDASVKWQVGQEVYVCDLDEVQTKSDKPCYDVYKGTVGYRQGKGRSKIWALEFPSGTFDYLESEMYNTREAAVAVLELKRAR